MKRYSYITLSIIVGLSLLSCRKAADNAGTPLPAEGSEDTETALSEIPVSFSADIPYIEVGTKASSGATVVTALASLQASATKGSAGSETSKWNNVTFTSDGAGTPTYHGGKYWPNTDESYHFYASNNALTFAAAGTTVSATNDKDVICAYMPSPTYRTKNTLTFEHIFARIKNVQVTALAGYTITSMSITIVPKTGGTYNLRTGSGQTNGTGWSSTTNGTAQTIASASSISSGSTSTSTNDYYLVPGQYTLKATWTATRDDYTRTYTNVEANVTLYGGKENTITTTLGGSATELTFGVSINAWGSSTATPEFPNT